MIIQRSLLLTVVSVLTFASSVHAGEGNLTDLDLATLMNMDVTVTSAARRAQSLDDAAAAVFVITREDIRRSGATNLPDILRLAPGMQVGRVNTRSWAVSARGFNHRFSNKLLVMVDGRSIYTSAFSGVMWEEQPAFLDDIERIEIVRGPGGALWGINAVNGVINIITRSAQIAHGVQMSANGGSTREDSSLRAGFADDWGGYRAYVDHGRTDPLRATETEWKRTQAGVRIDATAGGGALTLQGDVHEGDFGAPDGPAMVGLSRDVQTGSMLTSWTRGYAPGQLDLRAHYSWTDRGHPIEWNESALAVEAQFAATRIGRHVFNAGLGVRRTADEQEATISGFSITESTQSEWSVYGQDELNFWDDRVSVTAGAKIESSEFAGTALQPTLRGLWDVTATHTVWSAFSRASRAPSRFELHSGIRLALPPDDATGPLPVELVVDGNDELEPETMEAYEAGWRWRPNQKLSVDLAVYRNEYEHLILLKALPPQVVFTPSLHVEQVMEYANAGGARSDGAELALEWAVLDSVRLQAFAAWHDVQDVQLQPGTTALLGGKDVGRTLSARARIDLPRETELDVAWRSVGASLDGTIPSYHSLDVRAAWRPVRSLELSVGVENLFDNEHVEMDDFLNGSLGVELGRAYFGRVVWQPR